MQLEMWVADPEVDDVELSDDNESDCANTSGELEDGTGNNPDAAAEANAAAEQHEGPDIGPGEATAPANTKVMEQFSTSRKLGRGASGLANEPVDAAASDATANQAPVSWTRRSRHRGQQSAEYDAREEGETAAVDGQSSEEEDEEVLVMQLRTHGTSRPKLFSPVLQNDMMSRTFVAAPKIMIARKMRIE